MKSRIEKMNDEEIINYILSVMDKDLETAKAEITKKKGDNRILASWKYVNMLDHRTAFSRFASPGYSDRDVLENLAKMEHPLHYLTNPICGDISYEQRSDLYHLGEYGPEDFRYVREDMVE